MSSLNAIVVDEMTDGAIITFFFIFTNRTAGKLKKSTGKNLWIADCQKR